MIYVASVSFGKDSLAMLLKLIEEKWPLDWVVFYDTGMEYQAIYDNKDKVEAMLKENGISFKILKPNSPFLYDMTERVINTKDGSYRKGRGWCGGPVRWHTSEKTGKIDAWYNEINMGYETIVNYVGIAVDEKHRINRKRNDLKVNVYPLIEWGMTEQDCLNYCYENGYDWIEGDIRLYEVLDRVSCWCCRFKNQKELYNMYKFLPDYWQRLKELQEVIEEPYSLRHGSIFEIEEKLKQKETVELG